MMADFFCKKKAGNLLLFLPAFFVIPAGFEPTTHSLEGCCSIQLSYGTGFLLLKAMQKYFNFD